MGFELQYSGSNDKAARHRRISMKGNIWKWLWMSLFLIVASAQISAADPLKAPAGTNYIIGPGDVLIISIWKDESLTQEVVVLPDGTISFPLIGLVKAEGKSITDLKTEIEKRIKKFVPDPVLWVSVKNMNSSYIYVLGRVNIPGRFLLNSQVSVLQALAIAGGVTPFASSNDIKVFREEGGITILLPFHYDSVIKGKHLEENVSLKRGDVVIVP
jgi:polysaccharide biosynthesis/export protein